SSACFFIGDDYAFRAAALASWCPAQFAPLTPARVHSMRVAWATPRRALRENSSYYSRTRLHNFCRLCFYLRPAGEAWGSPPERRARKAGSIGLLLSRPERDRANAQFRRNPDEGPEVCHRRAG